jgi:hypothetical protein
MDLQKDMAAFVDKLTAHFRAEEVQLLSSKSKAALSQRTFDA